MCGRSTDEMIAIGYRTGGYMYGMQSLVLLGSLRCNEEIHVSVAQGRKRRARSNDAQQFSSVYTIKSIDFQGKKYVENDDDDNEQEDEQRVLHATEVASVDIVPMRKQRQRFNIGGWERNMVLHVANSAHSVPAAALDSHESRMAVARRRRVVETRSS